MRQQSKYVNVLINFYDCTKKTYLEDMLVHDIDQEWYYSLREILNFQEDLGKLIHIPLMTTTSQAKMMVHDRAKYLIQVLIVLGKSTSANGRWKSTH